VLKPLSNAMSYGQNMITKFEVVWMNKNFAVYEFTMFEAKSRVSTHDGH